MKLIGDLLYKGINKMIIRLNEKWQDVPGYNGRLWFSDSAVKFKNFMQNLPATGLKGIRLCVAPNFYLAAGAEHYNHDTMEMGAEDGLYLDVPRCERTTCGIPKCTDFELGNFEIQSLKQYAMDYPEDTEMAMYLNYDADKDYQGMLIADYGTFELSLYAFKSRTCPEYVPNYSRATYFEDSETYRVLKPMLKRLYIYGK